MNTLSLCVARPVSELARSRAMYCHGLDLQEIASFEHHAGFSGVMLGKAGSLWHLEFTVCNAYPVILSSFCRRFAGALFAMMKRCGCRRAVRWLRLDLSA